LNLNYDYDSFWPASFMIFLFFLVFVQLCFVSSCWFFQNIVLISSFFFFVFYFFSFFWVGGIVTWPQSQVRLIPLGAWKCPHPHVIGNPQKILGGMSQLIDKLMCLDLHSPRHGQKPTFLLIGVMLIVSSSSFIWLIKVVL